MSITLHISIITRRKNFLEKLSTSRDGPEKVYRNKEGMKTQEDYPAVEMSR